MNAPNEFKPVVDWPVPDVTEPREEVVYKAGYNDYTPEHGGYVNGFWWHAEKVSERINT